MGFIKNITSKAKDSAKTVIKPIAEELLEIPKQAVQEIVGLKKTGMNETGQCSPVVEAMKLTTQGLDVLNPDKYQEQKKQKLDYLEKELEDLKRKREYESQEKQLALEKQEKDEEERKNNQKVQFAVKPKRKIGMPFSGKKQNTKGTGEILKTSK